MTDYSFFMTKAVLITQSLQRDFIQPISAHEPLPNRLHVGRDEAIRLLGHDPAAGPIAQLMSWARAQSPADLAIFHVRDWHDASDPRQAEHLATFGAHCVRGSEGARLVLDIEEGLGANEQLIDAIHLNDFEDTKLREALAALPHEQPLRVGVVGVWTEAKVSFMLYDLKTRAGIADLATSSALTASRSRLQHFNALEQLGRILSVSCFDSLAEFTQWLLPEGKTARLAVATRGVGPRVLRDGKLATLPADDADILSVLYRDSAEVEVSAISGGFSGAAVLKIESRDAFGQSQAPSVLKLGPRKLIATERVAFERVEEVLGNSAPSVRGFVELGERAGIKYSYAAMGRGEVRTLKALFAHAETQQTIDDILHTTFLDILGNFYRAAQYEQLPLLSHYGFSAQWAAHVRANVTSVYGSSPPRLTFPGLPAVTNVCAFYDDFLAEAGDTAAESHYVSYVHGDLNAANILIDGRANVWLIDFFHTAPGHVLKDLAKLENDLLYILTPLADEQELSEAIRLTLTLRAVTDLRAPLPPFTSAVPAVQRAWLTLQTLRGITAQLCREDRQTLQLSVALLRYAVHTLSFDESSPLQKRWALAAAAIHAEDVAQSYRDNRKLRVDWVPLAGPGRLGITLCPGRRDRGRLLANDLDTLVADKANRVVCLLGQQELDWAGVPELAAEVIKRGMAFTQLAIRDQGVPSLADARVLVAQIAAGLARGETIVVHCLGGLGRSGTIAALVLTDRGVSPTEAIAAIRKARDSRALETLAQERFVMEMTKAQ